MKIGNIDLGERPVMLAPMEDVTDQSFRPAVSRVPTWSIPSLSAPMP